MSRRSRAREIALQALFQDDLSPEGSVEALDVFLRWRIAQPELRTFARELVLGVKRNQAELDTLLDARAKNWPVARMATCDRNILRLGAYEIRFTNTPPAAAINEAVVLAKRYGTDHSAQFVNGILDNLAQDKGGEEGMAKPE